MSNPRTSEHAPRYTYCQDPWECCDTEGPVAITCGECRQPWPCDTKRGHHTEAENEREAAWVKRRLSKSW
ncbi:MAG TPA: hypothetical protein VF069_18735 [Streptosporangiaceae bacterium]